MSTALTTSTNTDQNMLTILEENGVSLSMNDFTRVKVPAGGATIWEIPDGDDTRAAKYLEGVIVAFRPFRLYYEGEYTGEKSAPACQSTDGKIGVGTPGGNCASCPLNKWGSGRGGTGRACSERMAIYIQIPGEAFPVILSLPATSVGNFSKYRTAISMRGHLFYSVVTRIGLQKVESKSGISYSQVTFSAQRKLDDGEFGEAMQQKLFYTALVGQAIPGDDTAQAQLPGAETGDSAFKLNDDGSVVTPNGLTF